MSMSKGYNKSDGLFIYNLSKICITYKEMRFGEDGGRRDRTQGERRRGIQGEGQRSSPK
jgi:hypothetical protein